MPEIIAQRSWRMAWSRPPFGRGLVERPPAERILNRAGSFVPSQSGFSQHLSRESFFFHAHRFSEKEEIKKNLRGVVDYRPTPLAGPSVDPTRWRHPLYLARASGLFEVMTGPPISMYPRRAFKGQRYPASVILVCDVRRENLRDHLCDP